MMVPSDIYDAAREPRADEPRHPEASDQGKDKPADPPAPEYPEGTPFRMVANVRIENITKPRRGTIFTGVQPPALCKFAVA